MFVVHIQHEGNKIKSDSYPRDVGVKICQINTVITVHMFCFFVRCVKKSNVNSIALKLIVQI